MNRIDKGEIYKWFDLFVSWKEKPLVEIRVIGRRVTASGYFSNPDSIIEWLDKYENDNIYFTINSLSEEHESRPQYGKMLEGKTSTTADNEITVRDWLFIDIDPVHLTDTNASEEDTQYAKATARRVVRYLKDRGFNQPVVVFSGNGVHLYYRCNLNNTKETLKGVEKFTKALAQVFDDDKATIDPKIVNAARIARLPGTTSGKGRPDDAVRPQRMCRILTVPDEIKVNDVAFIRNIAEDVPDPPTPSRENDWGRKKFDLREFIQKHNIPVKQEIRAAGGTRFILDHCLFNENHKAKDAMIFQYDDGSIAYKCLHASCAQYRWRDVRLLYEPDAYTREEVSDFAYKRRMQGQEKKPFVPQKETQEKGPIWLSLDEIPTLDPDSIESIATGVTELDNKIFGGTILQQLSILTGRPGSGKSTFLDMVMLASVNQGYPTAIFSGELPNQLLKSWITLPAAGRSYVKPSFKRSDSWYVPKDVEDKILAWLKGKLYIHNAEYGNNWGQLRKDILDIVDRGAKNIILDNLMTLSLEYDADWAKNKAQIDFIAELHNMVREKNIHIWLVAHPRKQSAFLRFEDISGASEMGNYADNVFIVHRINQDFENQAKSFFPKPKLDAIRIAGYTNVIEISKNRVPGLYIGELVGVYYEPETKRLKNSTAEMFQYGWDNTPPVENDTPEQQHTEDADAPWYNKDEDNELNF